MALIYILHKFYIDKALNILTQFNEKFEELTVPCSRGVEIIHAEYDTQFMKRDPRGADRIVGLGMAEPCRALELISVNGKYTSKFVHHHM